MEAHDFIQRQIAFLRSLTDAAMTGTTEEQFNWQPPGTANTIRAALIHLVHTEDVFIQMVIQGQPRLWESGGWGDKIGLATLPGRRGGWEEVAAKPLPLAPALEYAQAVRAATSIYLETLTAQELDREVQFVGRQQPVGQVLVTLVGHTLGHIGEITAIKGIQGGKGLPF